MRRIHIAHRQCEQGFQGGAGRQWRPQNACILKHLTEPTGEKQHPLGTRLWYKVVRVTPCQRCTELPICKKPHANTLTVRTWDLMLPRPSGVLVTNPDRQLPCHFSKTVLRTLSQPAGPRFCTPNIFIIPHSSRQYLSITCTNNSYFVWDICEWTKPLGYCIV